MQVSKKCGELPSYLNQFDAYPSFDDNKLFKQKYKHQEFNNNFVIEYYDGTISTEIIQENKPIKTMYLHLKPSIIKTYLKLLEFPDNIESLHSQILERERFTKKLFKCELPTSHNINERVYVHKIYPSKSIIELDYKELTQSVFECMNVKNIIIPNNVTKIGESCFSRVRTITKIKIPYGVKEICDRSFFACSNLRHIEIPNSVTKIGVQSFCHNANLRSVKIPDSVIEIGHSAFYGECKLTKLVIPKSVEILGGEIITYYKTSFNQSDKFPKLIIPNKFKSKRLFHFESIPSHVNLKTNITFY